MQQSRFKKMQQVHQILLEKTELVDSKSDLDKLDIDKLKNTK